MNPEDQPVIDDLVLKVITISNSNSNELERSCWMVVHEHRHGVMPSEYDIRDIDEELYLLLLEKVKSMTHE